MTNQQKLLITVPVLVLLGGGSAFALTRQDKDVATDSTTVQQVSTDTKSEAPAGTPAVSEVQGAATQSSQQSPKQASQPASPTTQSPAPQQQAPMPPPATSRGNTQDNTIVDEDTPTSEESEQNSPNNSNE